MDQGRFRISLKGGVYGFTPLADLPDMPEISSQCTKSSVELIQLHRVWRTEARRCNHAAQRGKYYIYFGLVAASSTQMATVVV